MAAAALTHAPVLGGVSVRKLSRPTSTGLFYWVKGAVDEFFTQCAPRQVVVTYRESPLNKVSLYNSWFVRK